MLSPGSSFNRLNSKHSRGRGRGGNSRGRGSRVRGNSVRGRGRGRGRGRKLVEPHIWAKMSQEDARQDNQAQPHISKPNSSP